MKKFKLFTTIGLNYPYKYQELGVRRDEAQQLDTLSKIV
jgi:hypothetical protein